MLITFLWEDVEEVTIDISPTTSRINVINEICDMKDLNPDMVEFEPELEIANLQEGDEFQIVPSQKALARTRLKQLNIKHDDCKYLVSNTRDGVGQLFVEAGLSPMQLIAGTCSLLFLAASKGHVADCTFLLKTCSVDPNIFKRDCPLIAAVSSNHITTTAVLLEAGAAPNTRDSFGRSALMYATTESMVDLLLHNGADITVRDVLQKSAGQYLKEAHLLPSSLSTESARPE
eukprot:TRINITY_DN29152_c0_g1_i1.p1 TRINITY_DN29152_c0_g1~~TRINITY_DN29152_c0_g1_i1.p1  ORF type:complete len:232 (+),score=55.91 TRINITY_DN29152_c0_g1_i1:75-770(+)